MQSFVHLFIQSFVHIFIQAGVCDWARDLGRKGCGEKSDAEPARKRKKKKNKPAPSQGCN